MDQNVAVPEPGRPRRRYKTYLSLGRFDALPRSTRYRLRRNSQEREELRNADFQNRAAQANDLNRNHNPAHPQPGGANRENAAQPQSDHEEDQNRGNDLSGSEDASDVDVDSASVHEGSELEDPFIDENEGGQDNPLPPLPPDRLVRAYENLNEQLRINPNMDTTIFETLLMGLNFAFRHGLSTVACEDLYKMINRILCDGSIPTSQHMYKKIFASNLKAEAHMYCSDCYSYITKITKPVKLAKVRNCPVCKKQCEVPKLDGLNYFITLPVKEQLVDFLQNMPDVFEQLDHRWQRTPANDYEDIFDGKVYKDLCKEGKFLSHRYNLSLTFNTDGARVFNSGCTTLWPIFFRLNELHPSRRFDQCNSMLAALWFGKKDPPMAMYFTAFLKECKDLYETGFQWKAPSGELITSKVITLNCVLDSVARPMLQCSNQFNGKMGCSYCDHPGVPFGDNKMSKYVMNEDMSLFQDLGFVYTVDRFEAATNGFVRYYVYDRNDEITRRDMVTAEERRVQEAGFIDHRGIKGLSPLYVLPFFDVVSGFLLDYMHAVLIGTSKHLASLWFDSSCNGQPFYIRESLEMIDSRLLVIKPPTSISRLPRTLKERADWHANEWRSWLLFYSLPCLKEFLPAAYYKHHCTLVSALYVLLKDSISQQELESATWELGEYVLEFQKLYPQEEMFFNVHLLLHLGKSVSLWGPLWCYSMFSFESGNNCMTKLVKGSRGVNNQIASKYLISRSVPNLLKMYRVSDDVLNFCDDLMAYRMHANIIKVGEISLVAPQKVVQLNDEESEAFTDFGIPRTNVIYEQMIINGVTYHSRLYSRRGHKTDDSIVQLRDGTYAAIIRIIHRLCGDIILLLRSINTERGFITYNSSSGSKARHIKLCGHIVYGDLFLMDAKQVARQSILMACGAATYVTDFPNMFEKD